MLLQILFFCLFFLSVVPKQWVITYDSLMSQSNHPANTAWNPVRVHGYTRAWNVQGSLVPSGSLINSNYQQSTVLLGVVSSPSGSVNAVVYEVTPDDLTTLDQKHGTNFERHLVPLVEITTLYGQPQLDLLDEVFIYQLKPTNQFIVPNENAQISQSDVDVIIGACIDVDTVYAGKMGDVSFSSEFMNTTTGWNGSAWVNDRILPRKPLVYQPRAHAIDTILQTALGQDVLNQIQIDDLNIDHLINPLADRLHYAELNVTQLNQHINQTDTNLTSLNVFVMNLASTTGMAIGNLNSTLVNLTSKLSTVEANLTASIALVQANLVASVANLTANIATVQNNLTAKITAVQNNLTANIATVQASLTAHIAAVQANLTSKIEAVHANLTVEISVVRAQVAVNRADIDANQKAFKDFSTQTLNKFAAMQLSYDTQLDAMRQEIADLKSRQDESEKNALITWIAVGAALLIIFAALGFIWWSNSKRNEGDYMESIPLRPTRGYSYT